MAPAVDTFERAVLDKTLVHPGNPVLTWCVANAIVTADPAGNRKLDKSKAKQRIDGAVALAMALGLKARERAPEPVKKYQMFIL
jgi:phage terminase large subunit-like protein